VLRGLAKKRGEGLIQYAHELRGWFPFFPHYQTRSNGVILQCVPVGEIARARGIRRNAKIDRILIVEGFETTRRPM
jgi:hypothetical protein